MAIQSNIVSNLCTLTRIPNKVMSEVISKEALCIGSAVHDAMLSKEEAVVLNIGIGTLSIELATGQCKFLPSRELKSAIRRSLEDKVDPVEFELEQAIIDKLMHVCSEVL